MLEGLGVASARTMIGLESIVGLFSYWDIGRSISVFIQSWRRSGVKEVWSAKCGMRRSSRLKAQRSRLGWRDSALKRGLFIQKYPGEGVAGQTRGPAPGAPGCRRGEGNRSPRPNSDRNVKKLETTFRMWEPGGGWKSKCAARTAANIVRSHEIDEIFINSAAHTVNRTAPNIVKNCTLSQKKKKYPCRSRCAQKFSIDNATWRPLAKGTDHRCSR